MYAEDLYIKFEDSIEKTIITQLLHVGYHNRCEFHK